MLCHARLRSSSPGPPFGGITLAPREHRYSRYLRELRVTDARKMEVSRWRLESTVTADICEKCARRMPARWLRAGKGLVHSGCVRMCLKITCASRNTQVIAVEYVQDPGNSRLRRVKAREGVRERGAIDFLLREGRNTGQPYILGCFLIFLLFMASFQEPQKECKHLKGAHLSR